MPDTPGNPVTLQEWTGGKVDYKMVFVFMPLLITP
jgi:hypothetical protein